MAQQKIGYDDTPIIPGTNFRVHDAERPQPPVIQPPAPAPDTPQSPPSDAVVLFEGADLSQWACNDGPAQWKVENGYMEVVPRSGSIQTREHFGDCHLHVEWAAPAEVEGDSQQRGNSGVFLMGKYEIQVLDSYDNPTYADGFAGSIYGQFPPLVNACRKPGEWQTYEIIWFAPRFEGENVLTPARATVLHNGVLIHHNRELIGPTSHKKVMPYAPHPTTGPLLLQDHKDAVRFRNIWYRPITQ